MGFPILVRWHLYTESGPRCPILSSQCLSLNGCPIFKCVVETWPHKRVSYSGSRDKPLTHWGRVTYICVSKLTIIGSDNGLSPGRRQAIIWTSARILSIGSLETNFSEILIGIQTFSFKKMQLKMSSAKWCPFCLGLNVLNWAAETSKYSGPSDKPNWIFLGVKISYSWAITPCANLWSD